MKTRSYIGIICVFLLVFSSFNTVHSSFVMAADISMNATVSETDELAKNILNGDIVFTSGKFFYNGSQKLLCKEFGEDCFMSDGRLMADVKLINAALGLEDGELGSYGNNIHTANIDGTDFVCIEDVGKALNMNVYSGDNRDFVILSQDKNKEYVNSCLSQENEEDTDKIWRFMQFERPTGNEIYKALSDGNILSSRPRLLIKESEINALKTRVENDEYLKKITASVESTCKGYMSKNPVPYSLLDNRLFSACEDVKYRLFDLCTAYLITNKEEYAERAWLEMENALNWENWNTSTHFLDSGEIGPGIAYAYDVLNDYLSSIDGEDKRTWIRERVESLYLDYCVGVFNGTSNLTAAREKLTSSNWGAVCGTSMFMVAMSFFGDEAEDSLLMQKCKYIAENSMLLLEHIATAAAPEGTWFEGMGYYEYVMQHLGWFLEILDNTFSNDYGFLSVKGLADMPDYAMYNQTVNGVFNRGAASHVKKNFFCPEAFIYAKLLGNTKKTELYNSFRKDMSVSTFLPQYLLFYDNDPSSGENENLLLDKYYSSNGVGVMRDIWEKETGTYVGISGGKGEHHDIGSFIFDALGERWSIDMGRNGNATMPFLSRPETHSTLIINPSVDSIGQNNDESAYCIRHESKEKGSLMVYDLSSVYGEWADEYIRGFYLGDDRNTLTICDELKLKSESDIVWNMITASEIAVSSDGKSAVLSQNGKSLNITAQCSEENWQFEIAQDLAPTGGWKDVTIGDGFGGTVTYDVDSQKNFASGYRKLLLKTKAAGDVKITVKLSPDIYGEEFPVADNEDISNWNIPDGEKREALILDSVKNGDSFNSGKDILISEKIYGNPKSVSLFVNDKQVNEITKSQDNNTYNLVIPKGSLSLAGDTKLSLLAQYDNYASQKDVTVHICREYELTQKKYLDFSRQYTSGVLVCEKKNGYAEYVTSDGVLVVNIDRPEGISGNEPYIEINKNTISQLNINNNDIIHISYDLTPGNTSVNFMQGGILGKFKILAAGGKLFEDGNVSYKTGKNYHVEVIINRLHKLYRVYVSDKDGNLLDERRGSYINETEPFECRMYISTSSGKGSVVFDNLKLETSKYICPDLNISENAGRYELSGVLKCGGNIDISDHKAYVGYYTEDNAMTHFKEIDIFTSDEVYEELEPSSDTKLIKFFFWDKDLTPITGLKIVDIQSVTH